LNRDDLSLEERLGFERLVLLENAHNSRGPVGHVFGYHESEVTTLDLFIVEHRFANRVSGPMSVSGISELITYSFKHGNGDLDVLNRDEISFPVLADVKVLVVVRSPDLESVFSHVLSVEQQCLDRGAVGLVVHVNLEAIGIVRLRIGGDDRSLESSTEFRNGVAEKFRGSVCEPSLAQ